MLMHLRNTQCWRVLHHPPFLAHTVNHFSDLILIYFILQSICLSFSIAQLRMDQSILPRMDQSILQKSILPRMDQSILQKSILQKDTLTEYLTKKYLTQNGSEYLTKKTTSLLWGVSATEQFTRKFSSYSELFSFNFFLWSLFGGASFQNPKSLKFFFSRSILISWFDSSVPCIVSLSLLFIMSMKRYSTPNSTLVFWLHILIICNSVLGKYLEIIHVYVVIFFLMIL